MNTVKAISEVFACSQEVVFDDDSKFVIISDCHRGDGSWADNFSRNQNIYFAAVNYYYKSGYTYIELGDGDELWENRHLSDILEIHSNIFWILSKFIMENRLYMIYGNHDKVKLKKSYMSKNINRAFQHTEKDHINCFKDLEIYEGLVLKYKQTGDEILLVHGHQGDIINDRLWGISRFLVRYIWRPLENFGVNDPTRTAKNYSRRKSTEKRLMKWSRENRKMIIAGHTHRPTFPDIGKTLYFNDGSCVHPRCITCVEIRDGTIALVKWETSTRDDGFVFIGREVIVGPRKLRDYFSTVK